LPSATTSYLEIKQRLQLRCRRPSFWSIRIVISGSELVNFLRGVRRSKNNLLADYSALRQEGARPLMKIVVAQQTGEKTLM